MTVRTVTRGADKTSVAYVRRWEQLWARYTHLDSVPDWPGFITWLVSLRPTLRPSTWRQYRAAVVHVLYQQSVPDTDSLHAQLMAHPEELTNRRDLPDRTSSNKSKTLSKADMDALVKHLAAHGGRWDRLTTQWLVWGLITGLRPVEWQFVEAFQNGQVMILRISNAKHDEIRAHGPVRTVHVLHNAAGQRALLEFIHTIQAGDFSEAYEGCRLALWRATRALWPRRRKQPTLYSARHQFAADAKSAGLEPEVIAALMGHSVTETHQTHYGKRRNGRGQVMVEAEAADVARVVKRMQHKSMMESGKMPLALG